MKKPAIKLEPPDTSLPDSTVKTESACVDDVYSLEETIVKEEIDIEPTVIRPPDFAYMLQPRKREPVEQRHTDIGVSSRDTPAGTSCQRDDSACNKSNSKIDELVDSRTNVLKQIQAQPQVTHPSTGKKLRLACTCPNCKQGENRMPKRIKQHNCHYADCNKVYIKTSHLRSHIISHTGERPFLCNWVSCDKSFKRSDVLHRHLQSHKGKKKFECSVCNKRFLRSDHLTRHELRHKSVKKNRSSVEKNAKSAQFVYLEDSGSDS